MIEKIKKLGPLLCWAATGLYSHENIYSVTHVYGMYLVFMYLTSTPPHYVALVSNSFITLVTSQTYLLSLFSSSLSSSMQHCCVDNPYALSSCHDIDGFSIIKTTWNSRKYNHCLFINSFIHLWRAINLSWSKYTICCLDDLRGNDFFASSGQIEGKM